jgi:hypothetical protein
MAIDDLSESTPLNDVELRVAELLYDAAPEDIGDSPFIPAWSEKIVERAYILYSKDSLEGSESLDAMGQFVDDHMIFERLSWMGRLESKGVYGYSSVYQPTLYTKKKGIENAEDLAAKIAQERI